MLKKLLSLSFLTLVLKPLGYARDFLIGNTVGISTYTDIFYLVFNISRSFRFILLGSSFNSAFVPFFKKMQISYGDDTAFKFVVGLILLQIFIFSPFLIFLFIFLRDIINFFNSNLIFNEEDLSFIIALSRIFIFYLFFLIISSSLIGTIYSFKKTAIPSLISGITNVFIILSIFVNLNLFNDNKISDLFFHISLGIFFGAFIETIILYYFFRKIISFKYFIRQIKILRDHKFFYQIKLFFSKLVLTVGFGSLYNVNILIVLGFASSISGGITAFHYANLLAILPVSIFSFTLTTVLLPYLSSETLNEKFKKIELIHIGLRFGIFFITPITFFFYFYSDFVLGSIFFTEIFKKNNISFIGNILSILSLGIPALIASRILVVYYFAESNPVTPLKLFFFSSIFSIILIVFLKNYLGVIGIAYAYMTSMWFFLIIIFIKLKEIKIYLIDKYIIKFFLKYVIISILMIFIQKIVINFFDIIDYSLINLFYLVFIGFFSYLFLVFLFDYKNLQNFLSIFFLKYKS